MKILITAAVTKGHRKQFGTDEYSLGPLHQWECVCSDSKSEYTKTADWEEAKTRIV